MKIALALLLLVVAVLALTIIAMFTRRSGLRREFRAYLAEKRPDLTVVEETGDSLVLRDAHGEDAGTVFLHRIYRESPSELAGRHELFDKVIAALSEGDALSQLGPSDRQRLMPRIVNERFLAGLRSELPIDIPAVPLGVGGLSVVFVFDSQNSVAYIGTDQLRDMQVEPSSALAVAKENLARTFGPEPVRSAVTTSDLNVLKTLDTYDAARLLLVQDHLKPGESVAAMIPDRDTLVLVHVPEDNDWKPLRKLAKSAAGEPLYTEPLRVTSEGVFAAPN